MAAKEQKKVKSKLTLSVDPKYVYMLRRAITELVEEMAVELDKESSKEEELSDFVKRNMGVLAGKVKPEEWERDDRVGDILRKYVKR